MAYTDIVPVGTALIIASVSFCLGVVYGNMPYDYYTLFSGADGIQGFTNSLNHYKQWGHIPPTVAHVLHGVFAIGFIGCFIKIYKPSEDVKYFEYATLGMFVVGIVIYIANIRVGILSAVHNQWGEVDQNTGLSVLAASQIMVIFVFVGILVLQGGLYYACYEDKKMREKLAKEEAEQVVDGEIEKAVDETKAKKASSVASGVAEKMQKKAKSRKV